MLRRLVVAAAAVALLLGGWYAVAGERSDLVVEGFTTSPQGTPAERGGGTALEFRGPPGEVRVEVTLTVRNDGRHAVRVSYPRGIGGEPEAGRRSVRIAGGESASLVMVFRARRCPGPDDVSGGTNGVRLHVDQTLRRGRDVEVTFPMAVMVVGPTGAC